MIGDLEAAFAIFGAWVVLSFIAVAVWVVVRRHLIPRLEIAQLRRDVDFHNRLAARERTFPL